MQKSKARGQSRVNHQPLSLARVRQLISFLEGCDMGAMRRLEQTAKSLADAPMSLSPPSGTFDHDWFEALDDEHREEHPLDQRIAEIRNGIKALRRQQRQMRTLSKRFTTALPRPLKDAWLMLEMFINSVNTADKHLAFNLGVDAGRNLTKTSKALSNAGFDPDAIPRPEIFALASALSDLASKLPRRVD